MSFLDSVSIHGLCCGQTDESATSQLYGIEIELEGVQDVPSDLHPIWRVESDGSLRNNGAEFVSRTPATIAALVPAILNLYSIKDSKHYINSIRCGTHVHVDMTKRTMAQVLGVITTYALIEPLLMRHCGELREENIFCVPWYRATDEAELMAVLNHGISDVAGVLQRACKYSALYVQPLLTFGTIEFRMAPVWSDPTDLIRWLAVIDTIVKYGLSLPASDILREYRSVGYRTWLVGVLGYEYRTLVPQGKASAKAMPLDLPESEAIAELVCGEAEFRTHDLARLFVTSSEEDSGDNYLSTPDEEYYEEDMDGESAA